MPPIRVPETSEVTPKTRPTALCTCLQNAVPACIACAFSTVKPTYVAPASPMDSGRQVGPSHINPSRFAVRHQSSKGEAKDYLGGRGKRWRISCSVVTLRVLPSQWDRMDGHPEHCREATWSMYAPMRKSCPAPETA